MRRAFVTVVSLLSFVLIGSSAYAQPMNLIGVRAQGLGGAFTAVADDATAAWWNPAGLAGGAYFSAVIEYDRPSPNPDTRVTGISMAFPALGLSYYRLPIGQIRPGISTGAAPASRQDEGTLSAFGTTIGQSLGNHFVVGSTLKVLRAGETHVDLDLGAMAVFGKARAGVTMRNVTRPSFGGGIDPLILERQVRAGFALTTGSRGVIGAGSVAVDADVTTLAGVAGDERRFAAGGEIWTVTRVLGLRGGLSRNTVGTEKTSLSGGVSMAVRRNRYVDAQITRGSDELRHGWGVALRVTF